MAIGARRADVAWSFLRRGAIIGLGISVSLSGALRSLLYGVGARDVISFAGGTALVMGIALMASFFPAWKASKTDPLTALRHQ